MLDPKSLKPSTIKNTNGVIENNTIVDLGKKTTENIQKIGTISVVALAIIVVLVIILVIKKGKNEKYGKI